MAEPAPVTTPPAAPAAAPAASAAPPPAAARPPHPWRFYRIGGLDQVVLETGDDLAHLDELDQKLWVALSCPTRNLELDRRTLELLDTDKDGRVRAAEVLGALRWCAARLKDLGALVRGGEALPLSDLDPGKPEGAAVLAAARQVLANLGKPDALSVSVEDVSDPVRIFEKTRFNGDGIVPPESADEADTRQVIVDAMACAGSELDRSGKQGIDQKRLDAFFEELGKHDAWQRAAEVPEVSFLGAGTAAAWDAYRAVRAKVDDYFARCGVAAMDPRAAAAMNRSEPELLALAARELSPGSAELAAFPLAHVEPARPLPLVGGVNPAWAAATDALRRAAVAPVFGADRTTLTPAEWQLLGAKFQPWEAWLARKEGATVEKLGAARVRALLAGGRGGVDALIARDRGLEKEDATIGEVVRLTHLHRDLFTLLRNFVSFADLYDAGRDAVFQAGALYLDGRTCDLCVRVDDPAAHAGLAGLSRMYLAYCDCRRPGGEAMKIAACFTQGDSDYLLVGRNGVFYDRRGRDWDATIVKIVENPISIRQAFFAPYKKFLRMIEDQVARFAAAKEKEADTRLAATAEGGVGAATGQKVAARPEPVDVGKMVGIIAALGVGAGAIGTLFGGFVSGFLGLQPWWAKLVAVAGVALIISGPSMLIAWLKLRQRTLGPVLDACGWAVNGRVKVNLPLGLALTQRAELPAGARRSLEDPYEDRGARLRRRLVLLLLVAIAGAAAYLRWKGLWPFQR